MTSNPFCRSNGCCCLTVRDSVGLLASDWGGNGKAIATEDSLGKQRRWVCWGGGMISCHSIMVGDGKKQQGQLTTAVAVSVNGRLHLTELSDQWGGGSNNYGGEGTDNIVDAMFSGAGRIPRECLD